MKKKWKQFNLKNLRVIGLMSHEIFLIIFKDEKPMAKNRFISNFAQINQIFSMILASKHLIGWPLSEKSTELGLNAGAVLK